MSDRPFYDPSDFHPGASVDPEATTSAQAGAPLAEGVPVAAKETVIEALKTVYDPEIPVDIYELGLIYDVAVSEEGEATITMTLTSPMCPVAESLPLEVEHKVAAVAGISQARIDLVWEPPWEMSMMSEAARLQLGF